MKKHLIIGKPIVHSLSPKIHNYWFKKNNIDAFYEKMSPEKDQLKETIGIREGSKDDVVDIVTEDEITGEVVNP